MHKYIRDRCSTKSLNTSTAPEVDSPCHGTSEGNSIGNEWQTSHLAFDMSLLAIHCLAPFCPQAPRYLTLTIQLVSLKGQRDKPYVKKNKIMCLCPFKQRKSTYNKPKRSAFVNKGPDSHFHCLTPSRQQINLERDTKIFPF